MRNCTPSVTGPIGDPGPSGDQRAHFIRGALGTGGIGIAQRMLQLAVGVLLARMLGADGYGVYAYALSIVTLLSLAAQMGLPNLVVREVAAYQIKGEWSLMHGLLRRSSHGIALMTVVLVVLSLAVVPAVAARSEVLDWPTFAWSLALSALGAFTALSGAALRGLHRVLQGQIPEQLVRPAVFAGLLAVAAAWETHLLAWQAMALGVFAAATAFFVSALLISRALPVHVRHTPPSYRTRQWLSSVLPFTLLAGVHLINTQTDILMLGIFVPASDVGVYRVVSHGATLVAFPLMTVNIVLQPIVSRLYTSGEMRRLQRVITRSARAVLLLSLPVALGLMLFGAPILEFVFGLEYAVGASALAILCAGWLVSVAMGSSAIVLLNMTGHERATLRAGAGAMLLNILLNLALIPPFGMAGAATATAVTLSIWNVMLWHVARRRLGLESTAIGPHGKFDR